MEKSVKKTKPKKIKLEADITDIVKEWNENHESFSQFFNTSNFNEFLIFCAERYTIMPK